jgi:hypothetical protein
MYLNFRKAARRILKDNMTPMGDKISPQKSDCKTVEIK